MEKDIRVELTEERVREIVKEEAEKVIGQIGDTILRAQMGEEETQRLLQGHTN